jgi:tetratricopeptide (TPR) repeat protein
MKNKIKNLRKPPTLCWWFNPQAGLTPGMNPGFGRCMVFSLCVFCFLVSLGHAETSSEQPPAQDNREQSHLLIANSPATPLGRQLWQASITNPEDKDSSKSKSELYQIIEKIRSLKFEPQDKPSEPLVVAEPTQKTRPNDTSSDKDAMEKTEHKKTDAEPKKPLGSQQQDENQLPYRPVTDETLQILKGLPQHSEQLKNPIELADILFRSGHLKEAATCYKEALNRMTADKDDRHEDKAWVLFQIGNCLRNDDPPSAIEMYKQLIAEYPDLLWSDLAKTLVNLINWYQQDKPSALIAESRS